MQCSASCTWQLGRSCTAGVSLQTAMADACPHSFEAVRLPNSHCDCPWSIVTRATLRIRIKIAYPQFMILAALTHKALPLPLHIWSSGFNLECAWWLNQSMTATDREPVTTEVFSLQKSHIAWHWQWRDTTVQHLQTKPLRLAAWIWSI